MANTIQVLLFGDLTYDFNANLSRLAAKKDNALLTDFFERVTFAIRAEIGILPILEREAKGFVKFTSLLELLTRLRDLSAPHPALENALTCAHQFATFIRYVDVICQRQRWR